MGPPPSAFVVALTAINHTVELHTEIDTTGQFSDLNGGIFLQLQVLGFRDANGDPIDATLTPEPGTTWLAGLPVIALLAYKRLRR